MDLTLTPAQLELQAHARAFVREELQPREAEFERAGGRPPVDREALIAMLVALGRLGVERPDILEVDLNPVIASARGALAVDALVVLEEDLDEEALDEEALDGQP